jgi:hypothetical protein
MIKKITLQQCDTCKWWRRGDILGRVGNRGPCSWMLRDHEDQRQSQIPFWAFNLSIQTISWEGRNCPAWERATNKQIKENSKL